MVKARFKGVPLPAGLGEETFFLVHVENQASTQPQFSRRMFRYFIRLFEKHDLPVYPIVLFSFAEPLRLEPSSFKMEFPGFAALDFHFQAIQLNRLNWRDFLNRSNPVASALMSKMRIDPEDRPKVKLECLRLLATLRLDPARMQLISGFIDTYLRLNVQEQVQFAEQLSSIRAVEEREQVMQIVTSWMEEGIERGLAQGRLEGRRSEALSIILRQLARRVGSLPNETQEKIEQLSLTQLETLGEELLDFTDLAALQPWLAQNQ